MVTFLFIDYHKTRDLHLYLMASRLNVLDAGMFQHNNNNNNHNNNSNNNKINKQINK